MAAEAEAKKEAAAEALEAAATEEERVKAEAEAAAKAVEAAATEEERVKVEAEAAAKAAEAAAIEEERVKTEAEAKRIEAQSATAIAQGEKAKKRRRASEIQLVKAKTEKLDVEREARGAKRETGRLKRANKEEAYEMAAEIAKTSRGMWIEPPPHKEGPSKWDGGWCGVKPTYGPQYKPPARWGWTKLPEFGDYMLPPKVIYLSVCVVCSTRAVGESSL